MPITAKLSREFYERFGDRIVNEMVDLFNRIDEASRADLPLLNEQNASRFEARLSQQTAELGARLQGLEARIDGMERRIDAIEKSLEKRFDGVDGRIDGLGKQIEALDGKLSAFRDELNKALLSQTRWMIGAGGVLLASQVALWLR